MTNQQQPITPPPELVQQWVDTYFGGKISQSNFHVDLAARASQYGADQELEACCALLEQKRVPAWSLLRLHRRPKPPSLKEQALEELNKVDMLWDTTEFSQETLNSLDTIRRALEQLDD
jgi:hypothetical protein